MQQTRDLRWATTNTQRQNQNVYSISGVQRVKVLARPVGTDTWREFDSITDAAKHLTRRRRWRPPRRPGRQRARSRRRRSSSSRAKIAELEGQVEKQALRESKLVSERGMLQWAERKAEEGERRRQGAACARRDGKKKKKGTKNPGSALLAIVTLDTRPTIVGQPCADPTAIAASLG